MIQVRRGRASLREESEELASLDAPDDEDECRWPKRNRVAKRVGPVPTFQYLDKDDQEKQSPGGLNHLVQRNAGGAQWTWKRATVVVDSEAAEDVMPRSLFPETSI